MIRFGTLGAADITPQALVHPCASEPQATISVIAARNKANAAGFAKYHGIANVEETYADVINHQAIDAIYNPLPISLHKQWSIRALEAGMHVLCEKSLACNANEAKEMQAVANKTGLILMDAFHYRYHPLFIKAKEIYASGKLGQIQSIDAAFAIPNTPKKDDIRMIYDTAGGVTMDIGCYPISWVRHLTGEEPEVISATAEMGPPNVDLMLQAEMLLPGDIQTSILGDMRDTGKFKAEINVQGSLGSMIVKNPLAPQMGHVIQVTIGDATEYLTVDRRPSYSYQLDAFLEAIQSGKQPLTDGTDAIHQMIVIDKCYEAAGLPLRGM